MLCKDRIVGTLNPRLALNRKKILQKKSFFYMDTKK
jgi:hypothetical protein